MIIKIEIWGPGCGAYPPSREGPGAKIRHHADERGCGDQIDTLIALHLFESAYLFSPWLCSFPFSSQGFPVFEFRSPLCYAPINTRESHQHIDGIAIHVSIHSRGGQGYWCQCVQRSSKTIEMEDPTPGRKQWP